MAGSVVVFDCNAEAPARLKAEYGQSQAASAAKSRPAEG
jgi:hypothetical protein